MHLGASQSRCVPDLCRVAPTMACDIRGPLLVCVRGHAVDVLELVLAGSYDKVGFLQLRFEQLSFSELSKNSCDGDVATPIYHGHAMDITGRCNEARHAAGLAVAPASVRDGARLRAISEWEYPFMFSL